MHTRTGDRLRALLLAALLVLSVFAGTIAFTGTANGQERVTTTAANATDDVDPQSADSGIGDWTENHPQLTLVIVLVLLLAAGTPRAPRR